MVAISRVGGLFGYWLFWWVVGIFVWVYFCLWLVSCLLLGFRLFSLFLVAVGLCIWVFALLFGLCMPWFSC